MDTTVWVAIIVAVSTLIASLGATWLNAVSANKRFKIELERAREVDLHNRRWDVHGELLRKLRAELSEMDLWGRRLVETSDNKLVGLNSESISKLGTLIQNGSIELTLNAIGDRDLEEKATKSIGSYTQAYYFVKNLPKTPSIDKLKEVTQIIHRDIIDIQALINDRLEKL